MAKKTKGVEVDSDGSERMLIELVERFSVKRAVEWLRIKFPSFDTSRGEELACDATKNENDYFAAAELLGYVTKLSASKSDDTNKPILVAAVKMRKDLTERTSRLVQFNYAKKLLQNAIAKGAQGVSGLPSQGLFFFYDKDGFFRLSLVTGEVEKRRFKYNEAKRQSFYIEPLAANNIVKRRLTPPIKTFAELKEVFSVEQLTKEFYTKLFDWYTWAMSPKVNVSFPNDLDDDTDDRKYNNEAIIRMITRLMFTWFIRQRKLVPDVLFDREGLKDVLKSFEADSMEQDNYYRAILQNLFFATFNCPQTGKGKLARRWIDADVNGAGNGVGLSNDYRVTTVYRYKNEFKKPDDFLELMKKVPFLNCALFDCLDKVQREVDGGKKLYFDGFSTKKKRQAFVPNGLFFDDERGIINLFNLYEFTVNENNADDSDVALDPELLGKVFENLLGAFNPETQETARNATGSFYTPREIVDYMVEESLRNYIKTKVPIADDARLDDLFDRNKAAEGADTMFTSKEREAILTALYSCKILDPACGSGAFPMGILHCMVRLLTRLDPQCVSIREHLLARYRKDKADEDPSETADERMERLEELESRLKEGQHYPDYERKLYLIENCIYGVDIQPIATQISKLRFFISLLCDQLRSSYDPDAQNFGLLSLPNLEAKFVCANTLISLPDLESELKIGDVKELRDELQANRHKIFRARSTKTKEKYKRRDLEIRDAIRETVQDSLSKPDELVIAKCREQIADAKERRKAVVEPDWYEVDVQVQDDFFSAFEAKKVRKDRNEPARSQIDSEIEWAEKKIKDELAKGEKANVSAAARYADMVAGWDPYDQNASSDFFDPEWMFNAKGFDVVIGNPPYISASDQLKDKRLKQQRDVLAQDRRFKCLIQKWDLYIAFIELSIRYLLKDHGTFSMIVPYPLATQGYGARLRELMANEYALFEISDLQGVKIFENATVTNCIPFVEKSIPTENVWIAKVGDGNRIVKRYSRTISELMPDPKTLVWKTSNEESYITRYGSLHTLGDYCYLSEGMKLNADEKLARGAFTKDDLVSDVKDKQHNAEYIEGKDIYRYGIKRIQYLEYGTKRCPGMLRRPTFEELYRNEKLVFNILGAMRCFYDRFGRYLHSTSLISAVRWMNLKLVDNKSISGSVKKFGRFSRTELEMLSSTIDLRFILGIVNSKFALVLLDDIRGGDYHIYADYLRNIPIPNATPNQQKPVIDLVERILTAKNLDPEADTSELDAKIDSLVYSLYGLSEADIAIIEGRGAGGAAEGRALSVADDAVRPHRRGSRLSAAGGDVSRSDDEELE